MARSVTISPTIQGRAFLSPKTVDEGSALVPERRPATPGRLCDQLLPVVAFLVAISALSIGCRTTPAHRAGESPGPEAGQDWCVPELGIPFVWDTRLGIWVGEFEVTNRQYHCFRARHRTDVLAMAKHDHPMHGPALDWRLLMRPDHPVVCVTYEEALAFAAWLSLREATFGRLPSGWVYRLPTGAEWLSFASDGGRLEFPWGEDQPPPASWNYADGRPLVMVWGDGCPPHADGFDLTCPVVVSGRGPSGLLGVGGNAAEMTSERSPQHPTHRLVYGGSWATCSPRMLSCSWSEEFSPGTVSECIGFRLVLAPWHDDQS